MTTTELIQHRGMPAVRWRSPEGAAAIATLQGAHLVSWTLPGGEENLYVSERSPFEPGRPIRGGIPVVFPQFAERGPLAKHGFARTHEWTLVDDHDASVTLALDSSPQTRAIWPHDFRLELVATLGDHGLDVELRVTNPGREAFTFASALHTYLRISDSASVKLEGLRGVRFTNHGSNDVHVETRELVTAHPPIDRVYLAPPGKLELHDSGRRIHIEQRGFTDTVVWNPGAEFTAGMPDMPPDGYRRMFCVEAAALEPLVQLAPGATWTGRQSLAVTP